ncbi:MAG TPA: MBG domain-containing protein, partial [Opitutus sp.]|nr:MBG domain-containing protein [Opitutus sp.]
TATITGFEDADDESIVSGLQFSTNAMQTTGVGVYEIMPFGATATGYEIDYEAGYLTIDRAPLTITAATVFRSYGDENPAFTASFSGLVNDDTSAVVSGLEFATDANKRSNVGAYALNVSGGSAANYAITHAPGAVNISPATLTVTADDLTRVYGDPNPAPTITVTGLKNEDRLENVVHLFGPTHFATEISGIGAYGINLQGFSISANYNATVRSGSLTITQRPLTIVADSKTKVYGDPNPEFTATFRGLASFDTAAVIPNVRLSTQATQTSGVSTFGILVTSDLSRNYKIGYEFGQLKITPAELGVTGLTDLLRTYGRADPTLPRIEVFGLKNSDTVSMLGLEFVLPAPTVDAGEYKYSIIARNSNYTLLGNEAYFIVEPAPLALRVTPMGRLYGDANPSIAFDLAGLAFGQTADQVLRIDNPTDATTDVGTYNLFPELLTNNYVLTDIRGNTIRINPRLLTVDVDNHARYYGDATTEFTYVLGGDGLAPLDSPFAVFEEVRTAVPINEQTNVGWYRIDPIFTNNPNYRVSWSPGYLAIMPRPIEITVHNGVSFGNNNVPEDFDAETLGLNLILFDPNGSGGLG